MALQSRPPVITIMGHVDHGKTTLLDYLRHSRIAAREAGGITQHIGAYQITHQGKKLTFIDTPGHAAFNKMRQRGAQVTDIVILVVAADDGVKPQTIESIRHIKASSATVIVAVNKIDKEGAYPEMVKAQLAEHGILVAGYGGDVETVEISAKNGTNIDKLLETILITAELLDLKADPDAPLKATVIESTKDPKKGPTASVIVQEGTLQTRQDLIVDEIDGRVRRLSDDLGNQLDSVTPGSPAEIIGLKDVPSVGSTVRDATAEYAEAAAEGELDATEEHSASSEVDFDALFNEQPKLMLIIRADVEGTLEAIQQNLDEESVELLDSGVGEITERDLEYAQTTGAAIIAFHINVSRRIKEMAKQLDVKIRRYDVIYKLIEDLQKQMLKLMDATIDEVVTGEAEILQIFEMKGEKIAGSKVTTGEFKRGDKLHLKRGDEIIADPTFKSLMQGKEVVEKVTAKNEFGATFKQNKLKFQVGDKLVAYYEEEEA